MSTTIDRPTESHDAPAAEVSEGTGRVVELGDLGRYTAALATAAAGIIHLGFAPPHLDEAFNHGMFFLVAGWLQLALALALALRARPERAWLAATGLVNLAIIATWVISRTAGVPGSDREPVGYPDVTSTVLEAIAVLAVAALLLGRIPRRQLTGAPLLGVGGLGVVAAVAVVSMALAPSFSEEHGHNDAAAGHEDGAAAGHDDAGGGEAAAHDDAALGDDWQQQRVDALSGYASPEQVEEFKRIEGEYLAAQIRERSDLLRTLPEAEREERIATYVDWAVNNTISLLDDAQASGTEEMHTHGPVEWQPIDDPADQVALLEQLEESAAVIGRYPTIADAEAAGYRQVSPYVPGIGAHWINGDFDDDFDPSRPEMLLYNGTDPTSRIVGLSFASIGDEPPEGFVGPNDIWHVHPGLCMLGGLVVGIDGTPEELCNSIGGDINTGLTDLWMMHVWQVPGYESSWGLFSAENPQINVATSDIGRSLSR